MSITLARATNWCIRDSKLPTNDNVETISLGRRCRNWTSEYVNTIYYKEFSRCYRFKLKYNMGTFIDDHCLNTTANWLNFNFGFDYPLSCRNWSQKLVQPRQSLQYHQLCLPWYDRCSDNRPVHSPLIQLLHRGQAIFNFYVSRVGVISLLLRSQQLPSLRPAFLLPLYVKVITLT